MAGLHGRGDQGQGGKLKAAARHWAGGSSRDLSTAAREARELGAPEEIVAQIEAASDDGQFEVWEENWTTVEAFLFVSTQWRLAPYGGGLGPQMIYWVGLDYTAVRAGLEGAGIAAAPELWHGLRLMEAAARAVLNGQQDG